MDGGDVLGGRYRIDHPLGSGGMSVVWQAHDELLGRDVAIKVLSKSLTEDTVSRLRIRDEARILASLSHPNIAQVFDVGVNEAETPYVVMELLVGATVDTSGNMPVGDALRLCAQVAAGLAAAHEAGLVHRDIKPANIIVTSRGAKVVDFGIAAAAGPPAEFDPEERVLGTPAYLAPERLTGDGVEPASDVYSLGVLLYKLLAGRMPWTSETTTQLLTNHVYTEPTPLPTKPGVPAGAVALCMSCLAKDPVDRPTAAEVARRLNGMLPVAVDIPYTPARRSRRLPLIAGAAVATVVAVTAVVLLDRAPVAEGGQPTADRVATQAGGASGSALPGRPVTTSAGPSQPGAAGGGVVPAETSTTGPAVPGAGTTTTAPPPVVPTSDQPPPPTPTTAPPQGTTPFMSDGGKALAGCTESGQAFLSKWNAAPDWRVVRIVAGPASTAEVGFRQAKATVLITITVTCVDGVPSGTVTRRER